MLEAGYAEPHLAARAIKLTELLAQECINILMKPEYPMTHPQELSPYNEGWVRGRLHGAVGIKEHFEL